MAGENRTPDKKIGEVEHAEQQAGRTTGHIPPHGAGAPNEKAGAKYSQEQPSEKGARKGENLPSAERENQDVRAKPGQDPAKKKTGEF
jgi:hypothetical protein